MGRSRYLVVAIRMRPWRSVTASFSSSLRLGNSDVSGAGWLSADQAGAVDQGVELLVDRGHVAGGGVVGVLEGDHVGHLLVEVHARRALRRGVGLAGDLGLD